jgi:hypothetical protein
LTCTGQNKDELKAILKDYRRLRIEIYRPKGGTLGWDLME